MGFKIRILVGLAWAGIGLAAVAVAQNPLQSHRQRCGHASTEAAQQLPAALPCHRQHRTRCLIRIERLNETQAFSTVHERLSGTPSRL
jgi:hypothetical protein